MKIGVLGGTFNPPHRGHIEMARYALAHHALDKLLIVPAAIPPHKEIEGGTTAAQRLEMARAAFAHLPGAEVSDLEMRRAGKSFTVDTVAALQREYPGAEILLFMGSDMFLTLQEWRSFEELLRSCTICAFGREDGDRAQLEAQADAFRRGCAGKILLEDMPVLEISSSALRRSIAAGEQPERWLSEPVLAYIRANHLYQSA